TSSLGRRKNKDFPSGRLARRGIVKLLGERAVSPRTIAVSGIGQDGLAEDGALLEPHALAHNGIKDSISPAELRSCALEHLPRVERSIVEAGRQDAFDLQRWTDLALDLAHGVQEQTYPQQR